MEDWRPIQDGAEMAVISGDPEISGSPFVIRFRTTKKIDVPAHWHPEEENVTVLEGPFALGLGDRFDASALIELPAGSHRCVPRGVRHYSSYGVGAVIQVTGVGPFRTNYVEQV